MNDHLRRFLSRTAVSAGLALAVFILATLICLEPVTKSFDAAIARSVPTTMTDRNGVPLSISYRGAWNTDDVRHLYEMPELLPSAFIFSEDRNFRDHHGVDWKARGAAILQNIRRGETVRGASTITEQTVRLIHPRPRNLWSKWLEGVEATMLERHASKSAILEFYLNQVPFAANRRGVAQAARYYFNRDLDTLGTKEIFALAILARAPSAYDLYKNSARIDAPLNHLAGRMREAGLIHEAAHRDSAQQTLDIRKPSLPVDARHFARFARVQGASNRTTLNASLQAQVQSILDSRIKKLSAKNVTNAGAIVIDHETGDILAWTVAGANDPDTPGGDIDPILTPRQPGSTLKPFLYAAALEKGWSAATILNDAPIAEGVGSGLHRFRNYSNTHYGPITLRESLGNSLNIPAVLTIHHVGVDPFLGILHDLGFDSLTRGSAIYDEGLALGNGEVTLYELTRAYTALARRGEYSDLRVGHENAQAKTRHIYSIETASIIGNILSDPVARRLEFGADSVLNLPTRTSIKTGTSTDYRDAWTVGYNDRYTVGLWMGNLNRTPMKEVTGSTGPALALRAIFQILNRDRDTKPLYLAPSLIQKETCTRPATREADCLKRTELFASNSTEFQPAPKLSRIELVRPTNGLMMAYDPRLPPERQKFRFELAGLKDGQHAEWILNGKTLGADGSATHLWPLIRGKHSLSVRIYQDSHLTASIAPVSFTVR